MALNARKILGDEIIIGGSENNLAMNKMKRGMVEDALILYKRALKRYSGEAHVSRVERIKSNIAEIYRFQSNYVQPLDYHMSVLNSREIRENDYDKALSNYYVGKTLFEMNFPHD